MSEYVPFLVRIFGSCGNQNSFDKHATKKEKKHLKTLTSLVILLLAHSTHGATLAFTPDMRYPEQNIAAGGFGFLGAYFAEASENLSVRTNWFQLFGTNYPSQPITSAYLKDESGAFVAGPVNSIITNGVVNLLIFTDQVVYPQGLHHFTVWGKPSVAFTNNATLELITNPGWSTARSLLTGAEFVPEYKLIVLTKLTVKKGALLLSVPIEPDRETVAGTRQVKGFTIRFNTTASSESIRNTVTALNLTLGGRAKATDITNVRLYDGTTSLNTGLQVLNPSKEGMQLITHDGTGYVATVGTERELTLRFDVIPSAVGTFQWSLATNNAGIYTTGVTSAQAVVPTFGSNIHGPILSVIKAERGRFTYFAVKSGEAQMRAILQPGYSYRLYYSADLETWLRSQITPYTTNPTGEWEGILPLLPVTQQRFFSIVAE